MKLLCIDGPMNGAVYTLERTGDNTNRKPDGLWFDAQREDGSWVQHQYGFDRLADKGDHVTLCYRYGGDIPLLNPGAEAQSLADLAASGGIVDAP